MAEESTIAQEIKDFLENADWQQTDIDHEISIKSNEIIVQKNFESIAIFLKNFKGYVKYLRDMIDVNNLVKTVLATIQTSKVKISVNVDLNMGEFNTVAYAGVNYQVLRLDQYKVEISNLTDTKWVTDSLMVTVKDIEGTLVYPVITTANGKVTLYFTDGILTNYNIFLL